MEMNEKNIESYMDEWFTYHPECSHKEYLEEKQRVIDNANDKLKEEEDKIEEWYNQQVGKCFAIQTSSDERTIFLKIANRDLNNKGRLYEFFGEDAYLIDIRDGGDFIEHINEPEPFDKYWLNCPHIQKKLPQSVHLIKEITEEEYNKVVDLHKETSKKIREITKNYEDEDNQRSID